MAAFNETWRRLRREQKTLLCVGLDPDPSLIPPGYGRDVFGFLTDIIRQTRDHCLAYKLNLAFFESLDQDILGAVVGFIRARSQALVIADAKRGDIGNSAAAYARAIFEKYACDAVTVHPYMGFESLEPFLKYEDKATIVLARTSNPGASEFQLQGQPPLFLQVGRQARLYSERFADRIWLVVGATAEPSQLQALQAEAPDLPWLVPGVGTQGGETADLFAVKGADMLINVSRGILYAPDPAAAARTWARSLPYNP